MGRGNTRFDDGQPELHYGTRVLVHRLPGQHPRHIPLQGYVQYPNERRPGEYDVYLVHTSQNLAIPREDLTPRELRKGQLVTVVDNPRSRREHELVVGLQGAILQGYTRHSEYLVSFPQVGASGVQRVVAEDLLLANDPYWTADEEEDVPVPAFSSGLGHLPMEELPGIESHPYPRSIVELQEQRTSEDWLTRGTFGFYTYDPEAPGDVYEASGLARVAKGQDDTEHLIVHGPIPQQPTQAEREDIFSPEHNVATSGRRVARAFSVGDLVEFLEERDTKMPGKIRDGRKWVEGAVAEILDEVNLVRVRLLGIPYQQFADKAPADLVLLSAAPPGDAARGYHRTFKRGDVVRAWDTTTHDALGHHAPHGEGVVDHLNKHSHLHADKEIRRRERTQ